MKHKILMLIVAALLVVGSALPALAEHTPGEAPAEPVCDWHWDRSLWNNYGFELWVYTCDYGNGPVVEALWADDDYIWTT